jgi:hypothetical protein
MSISLCLGIVCVIYLYVTDKAAPAKVQFSSADLHQPETEDRSNPSLGDQVGCDQTVQTDGDGYDIPGYQHPLSRSNARFEFDS